MTQSETIIEETGVFKRKYWRKGKKRKVETQRLKKNPKKVVLATIRDLELYVIPYDFPETVFLGQYPNFTFPLDKYEIPKLMVFFNKARWFLEGNWQKQTVSKKFDKNTSTTIINAYNFGLKQQTEPRKKSKKLNLNLQYRGEKHE